MSLQEFNRVSIVSYRVPGTYVLRVFEAQGSRFFGFSA